MPVTVAGPKKKPNVWYKLIPSYQQAWLMAYRESDKAGRFLRDQLHLPTTTAKRAITVFLRLRLCVIEAKGGGRGKKTLYRLTWIKHDPDRNKNRSAISIKNKYSHNGRLMSEGMLLENHRRAFNGVAMRIRRWAWLDVGVSQHIQEVVAGYCMRLLGTCTVKKSFAFVAFLREHSYAIMPKRWWSTRAVVSHALSRLAALWKRFCSAVASTVLPYRPGEIYAIALQDLLAAS